MSILGSLKYIFYKIQNKLLKLNLLYRFLLEIILKIYDIVFLIKHLANFLKYIKDTFIRYFKFILILPILRN